MKGKRWIRKVEEWVEKYPEVKRWLAKIQQKEQNAFDLYRFCRWSGKEPPTLLKLKDDPASKEAEKLLDDFVADENVEFTNAVKFRMVSAVKSFFKHNYRDLARASGAIMLEKVKPYNKPRKEDLRKLWLWAQNPRDKALITFVCSTAIAKETITKLKWKHLEENWENKQLPCINIPGKLLKGHGRGRYKGLRQITFLTPEAKRDLLNYKKWIEKKLKRKLTAEDNIFLNTFEPYKPIKYGRLGTLIWRLSKAADVPFSWHDARRYVNTALEEIRMPPNWARKIRGRKVRGEEAPYSLPAINQLREKFKEAAPLLEFTSERKSEFSPEEVEKLRKLTKMIETIKAKGSYEEWAPHLTEEERKSYKEIIRNMFKPFFEEEKQKTQKTEDCENDEHCESGPSFKQIKESELLSHLQAGWEIVYRLTDGDLILKIRENE